jgi:hypothetical protein
MEKIPGLPLDIYEMTMNMILTGEKLITYHFDNKSNKFGIDEEISRVINGETVNKIG